MANKPNTQNSSVISKGDEAFISIILMVVLLLLIIIASWYRFHTEITIATRLIQGFFTWPFWVLNVFLVKSLGFPVPGLYHLSLTTADICNPAGSLAFWHCTRNPSEVLWLELVKSSLAWNIIFGCLSLYISLKAFLRITEQHPQSKYNRPHTLETFIKEMTPIFPHLKVFGEFDMLSKDNMKGFYRGMDSTREFAYAHNLIIGKQNRKIEFVVEGATQQEIDEEEFIPVIDEDKLELILKKQLGKLWTSVENLSDVETIIISYFIARAASIDEEMTDEEFKEIEKHTQEIEHMFWTIASLDVHNKEEFYYDSNNLNNNPPAWYTDEPRSFDSFPIDDLKLHIKKYINYPYIQDLLNKHAFVRTFIVALIYQARSLGVMAPCQMLWLRLYDREAWALVDTVGRPSMFSESLGPIAHYTIEYKMQKPMHEPVFTLAVKGYVYQVQSYSYENELNEFKIGEIIKHDDRITVKRVSAKNSGEESNSPITSSMIQEALFQHDSQSQDANH